MASRYFVQAYKAKGTRLVGQATECFDYVDDALSAARRLSHWRAGIVVFRQEIDDEGFQRGRPAVLAVRGQLPADRLAVERVAA